MRIAAVIVGWNVRDLLERCLASIQLQQTSSSHHIDVWVVDNASADGTAARVRQAAPWANLIANQQNLGFATACNQGVAAAAPADAILLLNPDAELLPGAIDELARVLADHPQAGATGPRLLNPDGTTQSSRRRFPTVPTAFWESTFLQQCFPSNSAVRSYYCADVPDDEPRTVDWLVGACLLIRRKAWDQTTGLDEGFFLYFEETDWFKRASALGWTAAYVPAAMVRHQGGGSADQAPVCRRISFADSKGRYYTKHFGRWMGAAVRAFQMVDVALRIAEDAAKLALGHKAAMRRERIAQLGAVLKWGCRG
ncbi:MAG: glycosyltransferase family 2 protein [Dehalococcoidia bacterium]|nr:glycosyltransferase family 2 protein [Dehalococcoidia bacterium]